ncbi:MAG: hypothetical protein BWY82_00627 [Verrucomicrobia bacterium ADurb.Bin474]|nr:MAG: hypothetical protein BWY82_00627 [Verrucomicrobia bacterium ADurb.Bin474]
MIQHPTVILPSGSPKREVSWKNTEMTLAPEKITDAVGTPTRITMVATAITVLERTP